VIWLNKHRGRGGNLNAGAVKKPEPSSQGFKNLRCTAIMPTLVTCDQCTKKRKARPVQQ
jgi:hypothetical protein